MTAVKLTWSEVSFAAHVGVARRVYAQSRGCKERHGVTPENAWTRDIEGACAEMAVAKVFGFFWSGGIGNLKVDVGPYQVRGTARPDGCLILHDDDEDADQFILVTGLAPNFFLVGWIYARDGKNKKWWCDPSRKNRPAFFVPQSVLRPISELWGMQ